MKSCYDSQGAAAASVGFSLLRRDARVGGSCPFQGSVPQSRATTHKLLFRCILPSVLTLTARHNAHGGRVAASLPDTQPRTKAAAVVPCSLCTASNGQVNDITFFVIYLPFSFNTSLHFISFFLFSVWSFGFPHWRVIHVRRSKRHGRGK